MSDDKHPRSAEESQRRLDEWHARHNRAMAKAIAKWFNEILQRNRKVRWVKREEEEGAEEIK